VSLEVALSHTPYVQGHGDKPDEDIPAAESDATDPSETSDAESDESGVKEKLVADAILGEDGVGEADPLLEPLDLGHPDAGPHKPPPPDAVLDTVPVDEPPPPDAFLEEVAAEAPDWDVGIAKAEANRNAKTGCFICHAKIDRGAIRLQYYQSKAAITYLHHTCCGGIPASRSMHSMACLTYQLHFQFVGHVDSVVIMAGIEEALPLLP
jgi:hypothetical protein